LLEPPDPAASFALRTDTDRESSGSEDWEFRHLRCECFENRHLGRETIGLSIDLHVRGLRLVLRPSTRSGQKLASPGTFGPKGTKAVEYRMSGKAGSKLNGGGISTGKGYSWQLMGAPPAQTLALNRENGPLDRHEEFFSGTFCQALQVGRKLRAGIMRKSGNRKISRNWLWPQELGHLRLLVVSCHPT